MRIYTDLTPEKYRCEIATSCPAVLKGDDGDYYIIGKNIQAPAEDLIKRVGSDETLVKIDGDLFAEVLKQEAAMRELKGK